MSHDMTRESSRRDADRRQRRSRASGLRRPPPSVGGHAGASVRGEAEAMGFFQRFSTLFNGIQRYSRLNLGKNFEAEEGRGNYFYDLRQGDPSAPGQNAGWEAGALI